MWLLLLLISLFNFSAHADDSYSANFNYKADSSFNFFDCHDTEEMPEEWENIRLGKANAEGMCLDDPEQECRELLGFVAFGDDQIMFSTPVPKRQSGPEFCSAFGSPDCKYLELYPAAAGKEDVFIYHLQNVKDGKLESEFIQPVSMTTVLDKPLRYQLTINGCSFFEIKVRLNLR
jgi:hypothetical protein